MSFKIERNDITRVQADAIVNTANPFPVVGRGTDTSVYEAAGREELQACRQEIGMIEPGQSVWTPSFGLKKNGVKYIIHTVGVRYEGGSHGEADILRSCYCTALKTAADLKCKSVAVPLLASGNYAFPKDLALQIAVEEISRFLLGNEISVCLVVYDDESYKISEKLFDDVEDFLYDNFEGEEAEEPGEDEALGDLEVSGDHEALGDLEVPGALEAPGDHARRSLHYERYENLICGSALQAPEPLPQAEPHKLHEPHKPHKHHERKIAPIDVDAFIKSSKDKLNFQNTLQKLIADRHLENATIYKKACIDKKFFSKIISNKDYVPKKHTVMALGLALELPLVEYEEFLASAGYAFMPSSKFDMIIKYCVINQIFNIVRVDVILNDHGEECFAPS